MSNDEWGDDGFGDEDGFGDDGDAGGDAGDAGGGDGGWGDTQLVHADDVDATDDDPGAAKPEKKTFSLASGDPLDKCYKFAERAFGKLPVRTAPEKPKVLDEAAIKKLLTKTLPSESKEMSQTRDKRPVSDMVVGVYTQGLFTLGEAVNAQVKPALHYVMHVCAGLGPDHPKRKYMLKTLLESMHDCQQVQAREILRLYGDLTNQNQTFEEQVQYFLLKQKDEAMDRFIGMYHKSCDEGHEKVQPWQQRAHLKSGYIDMLGDELGFEAVEAAKGDRFLTEVKKEILSSVWGDVDKKIILMMLKKELSVERLLIGLVADINNQSPNADRLINRDCIFSWVKNQLSGEEAHQVFWNEEKQADYAGMTPDRPTEENKFQPFIHPRFMLKIMEAMEFVERT